MTENISTRLKMKDDIMFKAFFSRKENKGFLEEFISSVIGEKIKIKEVKHDVRLEQLAREDKYGILDIDVKLENEEEINIEMQLRDNKNIEKRTTFYASKKIAEQQGIGKMYKGLKKVIVIAILDYTFIDLPEYLTKTVRVVESHKNYKVNNIVEYYYIELDKFRKQNPDMNEPLNQWLAFIDGERKEWIEMAKKNNKSVEKAEENYNILSGDDEIKRLAEIRMLSAMEEHSALEAAKEKGIEKGKNQEKIKNIKKMLELNIPIKQIAEITELTIEDIKKIK